MRLDGRYQVKLENFELDNFFSKTDIGSFGGKLGYGRISPSVSTNFQGCIAAVSFDGSQSYVDFRDLKAVTDDEKFSSLQMLQDCR